MVLKLLLVLIIVNLLLIQYITLLVNQVRHIVVEHSEEARKHGRNIHELVTRQHLLCVFLLTITTACLLPLEHLELALAYLIKLRSISYLLILITLQLLDEFSSATLHHPLLVPEVFLVLVYLLKVE